MYTTLYPVRPSDKKRTANQVVPVTITVVKATASDVEELVASSYVPHCSRGARTRLLDAVLDRRHKTTVRVFESMLGDFTQFAAGLGFDAERQCGFDVEAERKARAERAPKQPRVSRRDKQRL